MNPVKRLMGVPGHYALLAEGRRVRALMAAGESWLRATCLTVITGNEWMGLAA